MQTNNLKESLLLTLVFIAVGHLLWSTTASGARLVSKNSLTLASKNSHHSTLLNKKTKALKKSEYSWQQTDTSTALLYGQKVVWQLNHHKKYDKPYFYPVRVAGQEAELAALSPADHPWHRGLWFTWKLINEVNYWEENPKTRLSAGRTNIKNIAVMLNKDYSAKIILEISYAPEAKPEVLTETRIISISAPNKSGNYFMDWNLDFKAGNELVVLDRTPPQSQGGPVYGGYAGLSLRASQNLTQPLYSDATGWKNSQGLVGHGQRAQWMDLSGVLDAKTKVKGGITMFNHPVNPNSPVPWYVYEDKQFSFINAALLFDKPLTLKPTEQLKLAYRVFIHSGVISNNVIDQAYKSYFKI